MRTVFHKFLALVLVAVLPTTAGAAGFLIFEAGGRALGMGGVMTAQADDPSTIFFNPAGIVKLERTNIYAGTSLIFAGSEFAGVDPDPGFGETGSTGTMVFPPSNLYVTHQLKPNVGIGIGVFNPFGLGQEWESPATFSGRHISDDVDLKSFYINPTVAWSPSDRLSLGAGLQLVYATVELHRFLQRWDPNGSGFVNVGTLTLDGNNSLDFGFNLGALFKVNDDWTVGASFRSQVDTEFDGDADFDQILTGDPAFDAAVAAQFPVDQAAGTQIEFPWLVSTGLAYGGVERWTFEVDVNIVGWETFDALPFNFSADPSLNVVRPQDWETKVSVRSGAEYEATEKVALRFGYYFDPTPQPKNVMSPLLPDTDRNGISAGLGYKTAPWTFDFFALFLITGDRSTDGQSLDGFNGTYETFANLFGINVGYQF
ncbi:MAG: OmpP1/FadL family transporter [Candidatus Krumholzibacteriia bacterium]